MKLLMITGDRDLAQGKKGAFYNTLEEFHKYWDRVDIIAPKITNHPERLRNGASKSQITNQFQIPNSKFQTLNLFGNIYIHPSPWPLLFQPWWILEKGAEIYQENKFDLMTVHEFPPFYNGIGTRFLWNKIRVPYILEIHHIPGHPKTADLKEWFYKLATRYLIKYDAAKARAVRVVNQRQVPELLINAGVPKEKIVFIPSFYIDLDIFRPTGVAKEYDLIFVGRLAKNKGIDLLLETMKILVYKLKTVNCKLLIVGDGPLSDALKLKTKNYKLKTNVVFHGWAKDSKEVAELINKSRILIMPSYNEGGPRVVLEAMACGVPIITTRVGLMLDIIRDGESGLSTDWNPADMAEKILFLLNNLELQKKFSQSGLELVKQFERRTAIKNYAEKLKEALN